MVASEQHPIKELLPDYQKSGCSLEDIAKITTALSEADPIGAFTDKEIILANRHNPQHYAVTQIGITPIHIHRGDELDAKMLKTRKSQGILRQPQDYQSPVKNLPPEPHGWGLPPLGNE